MNVADHIAILALVLLLATAVIFIWSLHQDIKALKGISEDIPSISSKPSKKSRVVKKKPHINSDTSEWLKEQEQLLGRPVTMWD